MRCGRRSEDDSLFEYSRCSHTSTRIGDGDVRVTRSDCVRGRGEATRKIFESTMLRRRLLPWIVAALLATFIHGARSGHHRWTRREQLDQTGESSRCASREKGRNVRAKQRPDSARGPWESRRRTWDCKARRGYRRFARPNKFVFFSSLPFRVSFFVLFFGNCGRETTLINPSAETLSPAEDKSCNEATTPELVILLYGVFYG